MKKNSPYKDYHYYGNNDPARMDPNILRAIKRTSDQMGVHEAKLWGALRHFFNWQRRSFSSGEYAEYWWPKFGVFTWFNREGDYYNNDYEVEEWLNREKTIKDKNRHKSTEISLQELESIDPDKYELIKALTSKDPSLLKQLNSKDRLYFKHYGWSIKGKNPRGGWNILTIASENKTDIESLIDKLNELTNGE